MDYADLKDFTQWLIETYGKKLKETDYYGSNHRAILFGDRVILYYTTQLRNSYNVRFKNDDDTILFKLRWM